MLLCSRCSTPVPLGTTLCSDCSASLPSSVSGGPPGALPFSSKVHDVELKVGPKNRGSSSEGPRFEPGESLADRYRVVCALGRGGMGEVYRADDLELGEVMALKFLAAHVEQQERRLEMLIAEARTARTISHPNVCRVHDIGIHRDEKIGALYFVSMEFIDGEDLASLMRRIGRLPRDKALEVARELCAGLAAVHAGGLLHRDIKPSNVMLDGRGHVRLTDFGLATFGSGTHGSAGAGSPAYMAPEQHTFQEITVRSDVYSLGLVLYEIFTGQRAVIARSAREYAWRHLKDRPEPPSNLVPDLHPEIEHVVLAALEKVPERRIASVEAVAAILKRVDSAVVQTFSGVLCHNRADEDFVKAVGGWLEDRAEHGIWLDDWHVVPGRNPREAFETALKATECCVIFLGPDGLGPWLEEATRAAIETVAADLRIVPVLLPGAEPPP